MPTTWKILSKKFLLHILFFTLFFLSLTVFFKVSRLAKYFVSGIEIKELFLVLGIFLYKCFPFTLSLTCLIASYIGIASLKKDNQISAFSSLGLTPQKLFSPIIYLSIFLSIANLYVLFIVSPTINQSLHNTVIDKKQTMEVLPSFSRRLNSDDFYLTINDDTKEDLLIVNAKNGLSWILADKIEEYDKELVFKNQTTFKVVPEKNDNNSIMISESSEVLLPKTSLFSMFPRSTLRISPFKETTNQLVSLSVYALHPVMFTLIGIMLALNILPILVGFVALFTLIPFIIFTATPSMLLTLLSTAAFTLIIPLYALVLRIYKRGRA